MTIEEWEDLFGGDQPTREVRARRLPRNATSDERVFALAARLGIPEHIIEPYREPNCEDFDDLWKYIGMELGYSQPEFRVKGPGRPRGRRNKQLSDTTSKETARKRRQRDKNRKKLILFGWGDKY